MLCYGPQGLEKTLGKTLLWGNRRVPLGKGLEYFSVTLVVSNACFFFNCP
jgi:hypothetical protein